MCAFGHFWWLRLWTAKHWWTHCQIWQIVVGKTNSKVVGGYLCSTLWGLRVKKIWKRSGSRKFHSHPDTVGILVYQNKTKETMVTFLLGLFFWTPFFWKAYSATKIQPNVLMLLNKNHEITYAGAKVCFSMFCNHVVKPLCPDALM